MKKRLAYSKVTFAQDFIHSLLQTAHITPNGTAAGDIQIYDDKLYHRVLTEGALGLGESYMDGWWHCEHLDIFFDKLFRAKLDTKINMPFHFKLKCWFANIINLQTKLRAKQVAKEHYDLGNDLFSIMLDKNMNYSCGYWKEANTLDEAQIKKMDLICQKLKLEPGLRLLDIGCGWGGLARFAAENYGVHVTGVTISEQQYQYAKKYCEGQDVDILLQDYRDIPQQNKKFDRVVSVGMFEHVGFLNYKQFMETVHHVLIDKGLFLLHTIGSNETYSLANEWINKYIFPNGVLPSIAQIGHAIEKLFVMEDWHNFGAYYDNTLMAWHDNFTQHWSQLKNKYNERFFRMWNYYLLSCAGSFRSRLIQLWQIVLSKEGLDKGYTSLR